MRQESNKYNWIPQEWMRPLRRPRCPLGLAAQQGSGGIQRCLCCPSRPCWLRARHRILGPAEGPSDPVLLRD